MKILFLTETNLRDRLFIKDLVANFKFEEKVLLVHEAYEQDLAKTRMATKRLSALLSEAMVYNNAFQAGQRGMIQEDKGSLTVDTARIEGLLAPIHLVILGPVLGEGETARLVSPEDLAMALRAAFPDSELVLFTANPMSPLGSKKPLIKNESDLGPLLSSYEEERESLERALRLRPATILVPGKISQ